MDKNKKNTIMAGVFVVLGVAALLLSIFSLASDTALFRSTNTYYLTLDQAQGLNSGSVVSFSGIKIGNVYSLSYDVEKDSVVATLAIFSDHTDKIKTDVVADLRTAGALGDKFIYLERTDKANAESLPPKSYITSKSGEGLIDIITNRGSEIEAVFDILKEANILIKGINHNQKIPELIGELKTLTKELRNTTRSATNAINSSDRMIVELSDKIKRTKLVEMADRLESIFSKVDSGKGTIGKLINDPSLYFKLNSLLGGNDRTNQSKTILRETLKPVE